MDEELLKQGPREAPEPETAEERSRRTGLTRTAGGGVVAGGIGLAKAGLLGKFFLWFLIWHGAITAARLFGLIGLVLVATAFVAFHIYRHRQRHA